MGLMAIITIPAKSPIMLMTTNNSIRVKPYFRFGRRSWVRLRDGIASILATLQLSRRVLVKLKIRRLYILHTSFLLLQNVLSYRFFSNLKYVHLNNRENFSEGRGSEFLLP